MYLTEPQLQQILSSAYFTQPVTKSVVKYVLYQGKLNAVVHTIRFNLNADVNENFIIQHVLNYLMENFAMNTRLMGSINYDLLLVDSNSEIKSYYLWRANSNSVHFNAAEEIPFYLTYNNVYQFITNCTRVNIPELNIQFQSSNVVIDRPIAIVLSFFQL